MNYKRATAVLSLSTLTILVSTAVSPALAGIKLAFPDYSDDMIRLVLTIPPLFIVPITFLSNRLIVRCGHKKVLLFGTGLYLLGGLGSGLMPTFEMLLLARALTGIGCGFIVPLAQILIGIYFQGETRAMLTGWSASVSYLTGVFASFVVSRLAIINWRYTFLVYVIGLMVFLLNWLYLPDEKEIAPAPTQRTEKGNWRLYLVAVGMGLTNIAFYLFTTSIALFMQSEQIGTLADSGTVVAAFMLFGFFVGILVQRLRKVLKSYTVLSGCFMMAAGYVVLSLAQKTGVVVIGAMLVGGSYSILYSCIFLRINILARNSGEASYFICWTTAFMFTGQFLSQPLLNIVEYLFHQSTYRFDYTFISGAVCVVAAVVYSLIRRGVFDVESLNKEKSYYETIAGK